MIELNNNFFRQIEIMRSDLDNSPTKTELLNSCVEKRLKMVLKVQSEYFDDELETLGRAIKWDLTEPQNIKQITQLLNSLYKCIALDRVKIIDNLISLCEVQL